MSETSTAWPVLSYRAVQFLAEFGPSTQWPNPNAEVYDPVKNPDGVISSLAVAENSLLSPELIEVSLVRSYERMHQLTPSPQYINEHFELSIPHLKYREFLQDQRHFAFLDSGF